MIIRDKTRCKNCSCAKKNCPSGCCEPEKVRIAPIPVYVASTDHQAIATHRERLAQAKKAEPWRGSSRSEGRPRALRSALTGWMIVELIDSQVPMRERPYYFTFLVPSSRDVYI